MNADYLIYVSFFLSVIFAIELIVIYKAISDDLVKITSKAKLLLARKPVAKLLEYRNTTPSSEAPLIHHFQFKDVHSLEMIFDLPQSHIRDIDFTEDETDARTLFADFLSEQQRKKISYYSFTYTGYTEFLELVEKKLKWKAGIKRKILVLTELGEKKITFSHYLCFDKSLLSDVIDPEIFWGVDICVAVTHTELLPAVKEEKVNELFMKYDEIWVFEPTHHEGLVLKALGLQDSDMDVKIETEAYEH